MQGRMTVYRIIKEVSGPDPEAEPRLLPQSGTYENYAVARRVADAMNDIPAHTGRYGFFFVDEIKVKEESA